MKDQTKRKNCGPFAVIAGFLSAAVVCLLAGIVLLVCGHRIPGLAANAIASTLSLVACALCVKESFRIAKEAKAEAERIRTFMDNVQSEILRIQGRPL